MAVLKRGGADDVEDEGYDDTLSLGRFMRRIEERSL